MEELKVMVISSQENHSKESIPQDPITTTTTTTTATATTTCPTWKLYENPFYKSRHYNQYQYHQHCLTNSKHLHQLHLPISARKIGASFRDLTFLRPIMETELDFAREQIIELKAELEYERKARKRGETMNKRLAKELTEERRGREALERVCEELAREISSDRAEIDRTKREIEEERKMLRMAEVLREERVQMKLAEAKVLLEEKLLELEEAKQAGPDDNFALKIEQEKKNQAPENATISKAPASRSGKFSWLILGEKSCDENSEKSSCNDNLSHVSLTTTQRRASPDAENPHIKRGIKGFVAFPRAVRAIGSKSRDWGTKLECQKAQLRILLRQKSPIRSNSLIIS